MRQEVPIDRLSSNPQTRRSTARTVNDMAGNCTLPAELSYDRAMDHEWHVRCRNCPSCLRARQYLWQMRAEAEILGARWTYMFTGTWAPPQTWDIDEVKEQTTSFLTTLRSSAWRRGATFRYLVLPERHKSGAFHIHALIHTDSPVVNGVLIESAWKIGRTTCDPCDFGSAGYVTKYVSKDLFQESSAKRPRIRASRSPTYGGWIIQRDQEIVKEMMKNKPKENIQEIWAKNLRAAIKELERQKNPAPMKKLLTKVSAT